MATPPSHLNRNGVMIDSLRLVFKKTTDANITQTMTSDNKDDWNPCLNIRRIFKIEYNNFYKTRTIQIQPYWTNLIKIQIPTKICIFIRLRLDIIIFIRSFGIINYLHVVLYALRTAQMQIETENYKT